MERRVYRVSQVNRYVKSIFAQDPILSGLWVSGEISNFKRHSSGHLYFTLKDAEGAASAVMFASDARMLKFRPSEGMKVEVQGYVSLYEKTGQYQLYVRRMEQAGEGALYQAFIQLKEKLETEGLFDHAYKKPIPKFPSRVGLITSPTGAAVRDMIQIARRRHPGIQLILYPVLVQGVDASMSIVSAIRHMNREQLADVLIVGRGGGSIEDLWAFNEEETARAIFESEIPVISAVGHETDFTIADFAADLRAPTPSAAAELAVPEVTEVIAGIENQKRQLRSSIHRALDKKRLQLKYYADSVSYRMVRYKVDSYRQQLDQMEQNLHQLMRRKLERMQNRLHYEANRLELLNPERPLTKGYSILSDENGVIDSVHKLKQGAEITARLADGRIKLITGDRIDEIHI